MSKITLVTGLWDLGRGELTEGWSRPYETHYLTKFNELLKTENNLIIFGDSELENFVWERRTPSNTQFINKDLSWFKNNEFYDKITPIISKVENKLVENSNELMKMKLLLIIL